MTRKLFENMDTASKRFYSRVFNTAILNEYAVRRGWFDVLIKDATNEEVMLRWKEAVPQIALLLKVEKLSRDIDDIE